jgi:isopentenyl-diphosphate Delta-isomerase
MHTTGTDSLSELCAIVDEKDNIVDYRNKEDCHRISDLNPEGMLHRAFSLFVLDPARKLMLLQQRSAGKITFGGLWTNAVCSHPIFTTNYDEFNGPEGIKKAAKRRAKFELGIDIPLAENNPCVLGILRYKAICPGGGWCENEMDYVLSHTLEPHATITPNPEEVAAIKWVPLSDLKQMIELEPDMYTPWFKLAIAEYLDQWLGQAPSVVDD